MKPIDEVRALLRNAGIRTSAARDESVLAEALRAGGLNRDNRPARREPSVWRTIMKSRTTKLASAAVIVAAIIISLSQFHQPVVKAVEISEMTGAMRQVPWMHAVAPTHIGPGAGRIEVWINFGAKVQAGITREGKVSFSRFKEHEKAEYDPNNRTITLSYVQEDEFSPTMSSPGLIGENIYKTLKDQGAEIVTQMGNYQGRKVQVQEMSLSLPQQGMQHYVVKLYVDPQSKLLHGYEATGVNASGVVIGSAECNYDYPQTGPRDIYDLGVPRDAHVVDKMPPADSSTVWEEYKRRRAEATKECIAVIAHHELGLRDVVTMVDVDYRSGSKHRQERHFVFSGGGNIDRLWSQYKEQLGNSCESLLAWAHEHYDGPGAISVNLYDGEYNCSIHKDDKGRWGDLRKDRARNGDLGPSSSVADLGWPEMNSTARIVRDDYADKNALICVERLQQGLVLEGRVNLPARFLYYLDPRRDYLCVRSVVESCPDAEWQQDKNWLKGIDPKAMPNGYIQVSEITEAVQAPDGHWYPKTIVQQDTGIRKDYKDAPLSLTTTKKVYLLTPPTFPDGVFDIDKLPAPGTASISNGGTPTAGESAVVSFEEAKNQAVTVIKSRDTWPESPVAVSRAFWAARARKDYAEMEVLWPGSASYNWPEICKSDPVVEYVFGEAGADGTEVPYAAKGYFETNHKYNLTMRLRKIDTDKGPRYYVVSGN